MARRTIIAALVAASVFPGSMSAAREAEGLRLAYTNGCCSGRGGLGGAIAILEPDGRQRWIVQETEGSVTGGPTWSPDGSRIAYALGSGGLFSDRPAAASIRTVRTTGAGDAPLIDLPAFTAWDLEWAPSVPWLVFGGYSYGYWGVGSTPMVFLVSADGSRLVPVMPGTGPTWSPDGTRLAVTGVDRAIYVVTLDIDSLKAGSVDAVGSSQITRVSPVGVAACCAAWAPDGTRLAFLGDESQAEFTYGMPLWVVRADGSRARTLGDAISDERPSWSPTGRTLAYTWEGLHLIGRDGRRARTIYERDAYGDPTWAPDGRWIAFRTFDRCGCDSRLMLIHPDGSGSHEVAVTKRGRPGLAWSR